MSTASHRWPRRVPRSAFARRGAWLQLKLEPLESRELLALLGQRLFPSDNAWNQNIASAPLAANSAAVINNIISRYGDGRFHPDFGQDSRSNDPLYGIPFNVVHGNTQPRVHVVIDDYADESDLQDVPIPANAVIEGDNQDGPVALLDDRGDSHLIVYDVDNNIAYELYQASRPSENSDGQWHALQESVWNMAANSFRTLGWTSADAAGLAILPGLVRPDEAIPVAQGGQGRIDHAIRITLQNNIVLNNYVYPASHIANPGQTNAAVQVPMGTRLRLKSSVNVSALKPQSQAIALAMQQYGVIVADNGSNFFATGASYSVDANNAFALTWDDNDIQDSTRGLKSLKFSDFEVVNLTPVVAGLSAQSGAAGSTVIVNGSGFSGAAGRLQVRFGSTVATSVNILSDSQIAVVVPVGTGTVDVRVQSGINSPSTQNINNPIFGYGISAVVAADRFTYGGSAPPPPPPPPNQAPTVAQAATGTPSAANHQVIALGVLGADDAGEANLVYNWQVVAAPSGAGTTFSANGTNAARSTTATVSQAGVYTLRVTITDQGGLSTTSRVDVTVTAPQPAPPAPPANQAPIIARAAVASPNPVSGVTATLAVLGADDAGEANLTYTWRAIAGPGGAAPVFSLNGTNAARTTTVTFKRAGSYTFSVLAADSGGLTATSIVNVRVNPVLHRIVVPATLSLANRARWQFTVRAVDQFGQVLAAQPAFTWSKLRGGGSITRSGLYTAPAKGRTVAIVQVKAGGRAARTVITVPPRATAALRLGPGAKPGRT